MKSTSSGGCKQRRARVAVANSFLFLAYVLSLIIGPAAFKYYFRFSPAGRLFHEAMLMVLALGVALCLLEGVRGVHQRRSGAIATVTFAILWLLSCFLFYFSRLLVVM